MHSIKVKYPFPENSVSEVNKAWIHESYMVLLAQYYLDFGDLEVNKCLTSVGLLKLVAEYHTEMFRVVFITSICYNT